MSTATLTADELREITGYAQPARQLAALHRLGFFRARRGRTGVILERAHYDAVCRGATTSEPKLRIPQGLQQQPAAESGPKLRIPQKFRASA